MNIPMHLQCVLFVCGGIALVQQSKEIAFLYTLLSSFLLFCFYADMMAKPPDVRRAD